MDARLPRARAGHLPLMVHRALRAPCVVPRSGSGSRELPAPGGDLGQSLGDTAHDWSSRECGGQGCPGSGAWTDSHRQVCRGRYIPGCWDPGGHGPEGL